MYDFLRLQYIMGHITAEQLQTYVPRWLTAEQVEEIIATAIPSPNVVH